MSGSGRITKNISKPIRMWIDGKCFNLKHRKRQSKKTAGDSKNEQANENSEQEDIGEVDRESNSTADIIKEESGKLSTSFMLPNQYYMELARPYNLNIKALSDKTKTNISIPKFGSGGKLVIRGDNESCIEEALDEIHCALGQIRERHVALQFISIPLLSDEIKTNFEKFKKAVLAETGIKGMHESIFQKTLRLHLTVNIFVLLDDKEEKEAIKVLDEYKTTILGPLLEKTGPLKIKVSGLDCMNDNYAKVDVLYANLKIINETDEANLQKIANNLSEYFYKKGFLKRHQENVKLHMTLLNTKYRTKPDSRRWTKRESFDAQKIMEKYKDYEFGECDLGSIHISKMSSVGDDGFYKALSVIKL